MDTRNKIVTSLPEVAAPVVVVTGTFDVLRAEHARELEIARAGAATLVAVVLPSAAGLLSARERAEMVAALRLVDYVMIADNEPLVAAAKIVQLEPADTRRTLNLIEHVRRQHR